MMAGRLSKRQAEDQHSLSSYFLPKCAVWLPDQIGGHDLVDQGLSSATAVAAVAEKVTDSWSATDEPLHYLILTSNPTERHVRKEH